MFENVNNKAYSSPHTIYLEKTEKNLRQFLEDKADRISRMGHDILIELDQENSGAVLAEIKNNPELAVESLKSINIIEDGSSSPRNINYSEVALYTANQIIDIQSTGVDNIAGATHTVEGIIDAVLYALETAKE